MRPPSCWTLARRARARRARQHRVLGGEPSLPAAAPPSGHAVLHRRRRRARACRRTHTRHEPSAYAHRGALERDVTHRSNGRCRTRAALIEQWTCHGTHRRERQQYVGRRGSRMRSMMDVVDCPATSGITTTRPPRARHHVGADDRVRRVVAALHDHVGLETLRPVRAACPRRITTTASTDSSAASTYARSCSVRTGRDRALEPPHRVIAVEANDERGAFAHARQSRHSTCPGCSRSKTPLVKTTGPATRERQAAASSQSMILRRGSRTPAASRRLTTAKACRRSVR